MRIRKQFSLAIVLLAAVFPSLLPGAEPGPDPALLRRTLLELNGTPIWNLKDGYTMEGRFILKATGDEIEYRARHARASGRWAADFSHENRSLNVRYALSGERAWVSSPEITMDTSPLRLPYMARLDYFILYEELLRILDNGNRDPRFAVEKDGNNIHIRGTLPNGWEAVFILNETQYFPRRVHVTMVREPSAPWLFAFSRPDGTGYTTGPSSRAEDFEIWFSDPAEKDAGRYPRRMDFAEGGNVIGTCLVEKIAPFSASNGLFDQPPRHPWMDRADYTPRTQWSEPSFYLNAQERTALHDRIDEAPWAEWSDTSRWIAAWAEFALWISQIIPGTPSFRTLYLTVTIGFLCFVFLLVRRKNHLREKFSWKLFGAGFLAGCLILIAGIASLQLHSPAHRSLFALHSALRYTITDDVSYAETTEDLLDGLTQEPPRSMEELGRFSQAYALAYDLIRSELPAWKRTVLERRFFEYAKPLFGASHGWISNMSDSSAIAAGLGMIGLAIGNEPFIASADEMIRRNLDTQLAGGLHRAGPGQGCVAMDSAANLFYAFKHTKRADYYAHDSVREYVQAALNMVSPVGTLPLFGDTNLDQSATLAIFFMKAANQLSPEEESRCIAAYRRYREYNTHRAGGLKRWVLPSLQEERMYYQNPYVLLQHTKSADPVTPATGSAVLGNGHAAILRTGGDPDDLYLALNAPKSNPDNSRLDILTFDLYGYRALLLHGSGFPGEGHPGSPETKQTAASNSVTMNNEDQSGSRSSGIEMSLLNGPVFDYIRASADKTYDYGQVRREVVMVRPETDRAGYYLLIDKIRVGNPSTTVQWHLHGSKDLTAGIGHQTRWTATPFSASRFRSGRVYLEVDFPTGYMGQRSTKSSTLYSRIPSLNTESKGIAIEWIGSRKFITTLFPYTSGNAVKIKSLGENSGRIGDTDWISTGDPESRITAGSLSHVSELTVVRDRGEKFPAILVVAGTECRFGSYSIAGTKPLTASLDGLQGIWINSMPDTIVEIHSPDILPGDTFILDGLTFAAEKSGELTFHLPNPGEHTFRRKH